VDVGAGVEEHPHALEVPVRRGEVQRARVVADVAQIGIGAVLEQQPQRVRIADRLMQAGRAAGETFARETRIAREQIAQCIDVAVLARAQEFGGRIQRWAARAGRRGL
jgi:hypothetical protein